MSVSLFVFVPTVLVIGAWLALGTFLDRNSNVHRGISVVAALLIAARYLSWRFIETTLPAEGSAVQVAWIWILFIVEVLAFVEVMVFMLIMSRVNTRSAEADKHQATLERNKKFPSVDVFIPTYNEDADTLEKTIISALNSDYPDFTVWVLDDGHRDWLKVFCEKHGAQYLTRPDNKHAKAGNLNNALPYTKGELVAIFDADFAPFRRFLRRTVGFFEDPSVGIVQTPQHFFNKDPVQNNLSLTDDWPDEQRLFFDSMAPSRDAWNAAFCCGSCSIARREALDAIGGFPTASITEDLLTTLSMLRKGYRTVYLNEKLSMGLAAESLDGYFVQRERWCRGGIQSIYLREGPLGPGLTTIQRTLFFPISWVVQYPVRFMLLIVPIVYLLLGLMPLQYTTLGAIIYYQLPVFTLYALVMRWLVQGKYLPIVSSSINIFGTFRLLPTVFGSLIKPFGTPFRVTPKGSLNVQARTDLFTMVSILLCMALTFVGLIINSVPEWRVLENMEFFPVAAFWSCLNLIMLTIALLICFELPRRRRHERFNLREETACRIGGDERVCVICNISLGGVKLEMLEPPEGGQIEFLVPGVGWTSGNIVRTESHFAGVQLDPIDDDTREKLIANLFSGDYDNEVYEVSSSRRVITRVVRRLFGPDPDPCKNCLARETCCGADHYRMMSSKARLGT